jgi:5-dehydro-2-deoxygluconokinase
MTVGYDKPLYVLPFDHRATFSKTMFGWQGPRNPNRSKRL